MFTNNFVPMQQMPTMSTMPTMSAMSATSEFLPVRLTNVANIPNIPITQPKINFYDPFSGRTAVTYDPNENMYITSSYACDGVNVSISGKKPDVEKVIDMLKYKKFNEVNNNNLKIDDDKEVFPIDKYLKKYKKNALVNLTNTQLENWYYVVNPKNPSKVLATKAGSNEYYSGSGMIFFEKNYTNPTSNIQEPTVLLVKTARGIMEDMGGELDKTLNVSQTILSDNAEKEAEEESQNLFMIKNTNTYLDIPDIQNTSLFRCYFVCVKGTENEDLSTLFKANRYINVNTLRRGIEYQETEDIQRFYLRDVRGAFAGSMGGSVQCRDVNGNFWVIRDRTANCFRRLMGDPIIINKILKSEVVVRKEIDNQPVFRSAVGLTKFVV